MSVRQINGIRSGSQVSPLDREWGTKTRIRVYRFFVPEQSIIPPKGFTFFPSPSLRFYLGKINSFILQLVSGQVDLATRRHWIQCQNLSIWIVGIVKQFKEKLYCINFLLYSINFNPISHWSDQFVFFELLLIF